MKRKVQNLYLAVFPVLLLAVSLAGCAAMPQISAVEGQERDTVLAYAEPLADNLLAGINAWDYASFSRDFDPAMKKRWTKNPSMKWQASFKRRSGNISLEQ
jgi:hypothetical protein